MPRGQLPTEDRLRIANTRLKNINSRYKTEIKELQLLVKKQAQELKEVRSKLEDKEAQRKQLASYLYKPNKEEKLNKPLGKKPGSLSFHRPKPKDEEVSNIISFPLTQCPTCQHSLQAPAETVIRYEEDIDLAPRKIIRKFCIPRYWCSYCKEMIKSRHVPPIQTIGPNVMGYILYARYRLRLPIDKIKESLSDLHNFKISEGEITEKIKDAEVLFGKDYQAIIKLVKEAKVIYGDETGWRMDGENWWLWVFVTDKGIRYTLEMTRGKGVAEEALGKKQDRVIVSDGYAVYTNLPGENQQCWVHLLRNAKLASPLLYQDLVRLYLKLGTELTKPISERDPPRFIQQLDVLISKKYHELQAKKIQNRIAKHKNQLLTCLKYNNVLPENNTAERAIRPQVVMRKIFGGSRSVAGAKAHEVNSSVIATLLQQNPNKNFFDLVLPLIRQRIGEKAKKS